MIIYILLHDGGELYSHQAWEPVGVFTSHEAAMAEAKRRMGEEPCAGEYLTADYFGIATANLDETGANVMGTLRTLERIAKEGG